MSDKTKHQVSLERNTPAQIEHDKYFAPRSTHESPEVFLRRAMKEHRESHSELVDWYKEDRSREGSLGAGKTAEYQEVACERYDQMFEALDAIMSEYSRLSEVRSVKPPRNPSSELYMKMNGIEP